MSVPFGKVATMPPLRGLKTVRSKIHGYGVTFTDISHKDRRRIEAFVAHVGKPPKS